MKVESEKRGEKPSGVECVGTYVCDIICHLRYSAKRVLRNNMLDPHHPHHHHHQQHQQQEALQWWWNGT